MLLRLLKGIDRTRFMPHVISLTSMGELGSKIVSLGIPVDVLGMRYRVPNPIGFFKLVRLLHKLKPELVHTWMYHADLIGGAAAKLARVPAIVWCVRSSDFLLPNTPWSSKLVLKMCASLSRWLPDLVLYNSNRGLEFHKTVGYKELNSRVVPNGVDLDIFKPNEQARLTVRKELGVSPTTQLIGLIGRFDPLKNHAGFIQAAKILHKTMPEVQFVMAGQGVVWANDALSLLITDANLTSHFHLLGPRSDIQRITAALDLATLASWSEAFPNVLIEAMASCVPSVSTDVGDAAIIIGNDDWIVPVGDMNELASRWARNLSLRIDDRRAMAIEARDRVLEMFEIGRVVHRYEEIFQFVKQNKQFPN